MLYNFFALLPLLFIALDQAKLTRVRVNDNITISIPSDWRPMDDLDFTERYPSVRAPLAAYTNAERTIDFSVNISATRWPDANLELASQFFEASIRNMFDKVEMIDKGIREVNGNRFLYFEFESRVQGSRQELGLADPVLRYSCIQYLIQPERTLVFSFNSPRRSRQEWEPTAALMMKSVRVK